MSEAMHQFKVVLRNTPNETIDADYFMLDGGALIFRRVIGFNKYPVVVKAFAPTTWTSVECIK